MQRPTTFTAGFEVGKLLADPAFRDLLQKAGWRSGEPIAGTYPETPLSEVLTIAVAEQYEGQPIWLVVLDGGAEHGVRVLQLGKIFQ